MADPPSDMFVKKAQFTKTVYRDVYPTINPANPSNSIAGKVIVITGPSKGLGRLVSLLQIRASCNSLIVRESKFIVDND
jgi:malonyl CoA-acyl carrier protein transacylase